jgi:hypothetical protein
VRRALAVAVILATAASAPACGTATSADTTSCGEGKGHWIEDDNGFFNETRVTVRLCLDDGGNVIDLEVE